MPRWPKFRIAYVSNTEPEFSTESYLCAAFQQLGWEVIRLQENRVSTDDIFLAARQSDFLAITHTHGWTIRERPGLTMFDVLDGLRAENIPTIGLHQDRYWGIADREEMMKSHWYFRCSEMWTSDGGNQEKFNSLGINHFWFPPGICQTHCFRGRVRDEYRADVCYVGARGYHDAIYPFRCEMVDWLADTEHEWSVIRFGGDKPTVRGPELNDIYASAKIVVGDSIFIGQGNGHYYSDRVPETMGRNGFLLHPACEGMDFPMASYAPQSIKNLNEEIEYYLVHENEREELRRAGFEYWRQNGTWAHRLLSVLNHLNLN